MPFWVHGRDSNSGQPAEPFFSDASSEDAARSQATAQGIIVESIKLHVEDDSPEQATSVLQPSEIPQPLPETHQHSPRSWRTVTIFGVVNLLAAAEAAVFGMFFLPTANW